MPKWEYAVVPLAEGLKETDNTSLKDLLDKWGYDEWELVSVVTLTAQKGTSMVAYFKRLKYKK